MVPTCDPVPLLTQLLAQPVYSDLQFQASMTELFLLPLFLFHVLRRPFSMLFLFPVHQIDKLHFKLNDIVKIFHERNKKMHVNVKINKRN